ncbi:MAG TPA: hypothetical protein VMA71_08990 [Alloacidobacterium sp.]|nr:hypothetical protein [Alloacidobacterium sp.]
MLQNDPEFEAKLAQAVASYADPADAGHAQVLTARVLSAIGRKQRPQRWGLRFVLGTATLACVLLIVFLTQRQPRPVNQSARAPLPASVLALPSAPASAASSKVHIQRFHLAAVRDRTKHLPKLDQFPAPAPMTEQEKLLIQFVAHAPPSTQQLIAKTQKESDESLRIAKLTIPDLNSSNQP